MHDIYGSRGCRALVEHGLEFLRISLNLNIAQPFRQVVGFTP